MLNIVLVEPEIPANTGNISRTCACTDCSLHLVEPLGFSIDDKSLKRAGLDYWHLLDVHTYANFEEFRLSNSGRYWYCSTKAPKRHSDVRFEDGDYLIFGKETKGLPEDLLYAHPDECIRIPMRSEARSLNLSNSVAIVVYEALRQLDYPGLLEFGKMGDHTAKE